MTDVRGSQHGAIRVGIIGLGEAGATIHLPALRGLHDVAIVGAADPDERRRNGVQARYGTPSYADVDALLAQTRPELVIVASPPSWHVAHCVAAMEAGADVLCEKPVAASVREAREMLNRASALGRQVAVNHEFRAMPIFRDLIAAARADDGGPTVTQVWQLINHRPTGETGWRGQLRRRSLYEAGVHLVDLALQLYGETPRSVRASFGAEPGESSGADAIVLVTLEFARGRLAQLMQCRVHRGDRQYLEVRADTRQASYRASFGGRARVTAGFLRSSRPHVALERGSSGMAWRERGATRAPFARNGPTPLVTSTRDVIRGCVAAIRAGTPLPYPASEGVGALRVIAAAYRAAELGRSVSLDGPDRETTEAMPLAETLNP